MILYIKQTRANQMYYTVDKQTNKPNIQCVPHRSLFFLKPQLQTIPSVLLYMILNTNLKWPLMELNI